MCLAEYVISYEFEPFSVMMKKAFSFAIKDKKRLIHGILYAIYIWIFSKRFIQMIKGIAFSMFKMLRSMFHKPNLKGFYNIWQLLSNLRKNMSLRNLFGVFVQIIGVLYRLFIFV